MRRLIFISISFVGDLLFRLAKHFRGRNDQFYLALCLDNFSLHVSLEVSHNIPLQLLRDKQLLFIIGALLVVDSAVVLVWVFVDPMNKQITNLTIEVLIIFILDLV